MTPSSQQHPHTATGGKSGQKTHPAKTAAPTGLPPGPEPSGGPFRHATGDGEPTPKYETPQEDLPPQNDDVTTSAESVNLEHYVPGSANGSPAPTKTNFTPQRGS